MTHATTFVAVAAVAGLVGLGTPASAQTATVVHVSAVLNTSTRPAAASSVVARTATQGEIQGMVVDSKGRPVSGAMVSALGSRSHSA